MAERMLTFEEYTKHLEQALVAFKTYWGDNSEVNPEHFPLEMYATDWDEQFAAWQESIQEWIPPKEGT